MRERVEDSFKLLEDRVRRAAERLKELQAETRSLRGELAAAKARGEEAERRLAAAADEDGSHAEDAKRADGLAREVKTLRREREEIRQRIARLVELLDGLE